MARAAATDFLQSFRFQCIAIGRDGANKLVASGRPEAGFSAVGSPSMSVEAAEYREGHYVFTRKQPGLPSMEDIEMSRGVTRQDSAFYAWMQQVVLGGGGEYRADIDVKHYGRAALAQGSPIIKSDAKPDIIYHVKEAFPIREKTTADFEATSAEISVANLGVSYEYYETEYVK